MAPPASSRASSPQPDPSLEAHLRYSVGELHLDVEFSLTTPHHVLFGPSGAGKSTLLRLLAGLLAPGDGSISLNGRCLTDTSACIALPPGSRGIGYLTQDPALFPHLTVEANLAFGLRHLHRKVRNAEVETLVSFFSLQPLARRTPVRLSGGERQRVALARALAPAPSLLLLDEPFAALDVPLRQATHAALDRWLARRLSLTGRPTMVLTVSHDVAEVYSSNTNVLLLEHGRLLAQGPARRTLAAQRDRVLHQLGSVDRDSKQ